MMPETLRKGSLALLPGCCQRVLMSQRTGYRYKLIHWHNSPSWLPSSCAGCQYWLGDSIAFPWKCVPGKCLSEVVIASIQSAVMSSDLPSLARLYVGLHDRNVVCCAVVLPEASLTCSSEPILFNPAADSPRLHCSIQL